MKKVDKIIDKIEFTPDCQNKWDFDYPLLTISSRGYDWDSKSFFVGYYLNDGDDLEPIIKDELVSSDFETLKNDVRRWYKENYVKALSILLKKAKTRKKK